MQQVALLRKLLLPLRWSISLAACNHHNFARLVPNLHMLKIKQNIARLDELIDSKHVYVSECRSLKVALANLLDVVKNLKEDEEVQFSDELLSARIYATKTYALLDTIASGCKTSVYWKTCISWITCSWLRDAVLEELEKQQKEAESLANEFPKLLSKPEGDEKQTSRELSAAKQGGVHTLELTTGHHLDCSIKRGKTLSFDVTDSKQPQQVRAYTVKTWIRNPKSWLWVARRLCATVSYAVELQLTGFGVQGLVQGRTATRLLEVEGKKMWTGVVYKCFVKKTGEVLAIYRHDRNPCLSRCCGSSASGVVQFLGMGSQPQLRDLILSTFVAMGLTSGL